MKSILVIAATIMLVITLGVTTSAAETKPDVLDTENEDAKLLVLKSILNNYVVEGSDIVVKYDIYNVGNLPALNVKLNEENFPKDKFEHVTGFETAKWSKIQPTTNVTHTAIVRPKVFGYYNFTHATVTYTSNEKTSRVLTGYSTEIGEAYILRQKDYNRRFASHTLDWILFAVMAAPSIVFPYLLWFQSKSKYERRQSNAQPSPRKTE